MASMLIEIKSQQVLPRSDEVEDEIDDPRQELVQRLLEYKKYRDAASILEEQSRAWQQHYPRLAIDLPGPRARFGRRADRRGRALGPSERVRPHHARNGRRTAVEHRPMTTRRSTCIWPAFKSGCSPRAGCCFRDLFQPGMHKSQLVGIFLATLELVRHHHVHVDQKRNLSAKIWIFPDRNAATPLNVAGRR